MMAAPNPQDAIYGRFLRVTPIEVASLLDGYPGMWWISGGWALEAFTDVERPHEDIDVSIDVVDIGALADHFRGTHHVWAVGSGSMKALLEPGDTYPDWAGQIWIRRDAYSPWLVDFLVSRVVDERWVFKRDPFINLPFGQATWVGPDGVTYERPEITLLYKAKHNREKDRSDLATALPQMSAEAKDWLVRQIARVHPGHPWIELMTS